MEWDLGLRGVALLLSMSMAFGLIAQVLVRGSTPRYLWAIAAGTYFLSGLFVSEVWFGWATEEDLQPNIDGLSFDEVLLLAPLPGVAAVLITRQLTLRHRRQAHDEAVSPPGS